MSPHPLPLSRERERGEKLFWLGAAIWTALAVLLAVRVSGQAVDDFFITYRYAWNLVHGHGFVFNPGERIFGLTDPGLGLLLGALHFITRLPIPLLGTVSTAASLVGIALVLLREGIERERRIEALIGGTLVVASTWLWVDQGAGVFPALFLLLLAARLGDRRPALAGLLAGAAVWMRPDAICGVILLGLLLAIEARRIPWRFAMAALAVVAAGVAAAWLWFGTALPNTLGAKAAMAAAAPGTAWAGPVRFWQRALVFLPRHWGPWWTAVAAVGIAGLVPFFAGSGRAGRLLVLFGIALAVAYPLLGVPFFHWYTVPTAAAVLYGIPALALAPGRLPALRPRRLLGGAVALAVLLPLLASLLPTAWSWFRGFGWQRHLETYRQAGLWIRERSAPDEAIAYVEIGVLAYASERPVVDLLGLVTPEAVPYVLAKDLPGAFLARPAPWVIHHTRGRMDSIVQRRWFRRNFRDATRFDEPGGGRLTVYRIRPGAKLPRARTPRLGAGLRQSRVESEAAGGRRRSDLSTANIVGAGARRMLAPATMHNGQGPAPAHEPVPQGGRPESGVPSPGALVLQLSMSARDLSPPPLLRFPTASSRRGTDSVSCAGSPFWRTVDVI